MPGQRAHAPLLLVLASALVSGGCDDLRQFSGDWRGAISADPNHQHGFPASAVLGARVGSVARYQIELDLLLPGRSEAAPFQAVRHAADDVLGDVRLHGDPLRTYFGFVRPPTGEAYLAVVSLFSESRLEVRLIRGPDEIYAVFYLTRVRPGEAGAQADAGRG